MEAVTKIFEKLSARDQNNAKLLRSLERADASTPDRGTSPCSSSEAKRKRAKERQAKLLQAFASKQRIFEAQMEAEDLVLPEVCYSSILYSSFPAHSMYWCNTCNTFTRRRKKWQARARPVTPA